MENVPCPAQEADGHTLAADVHNHNLVAVAHIQDEEVAHHNLAVDGRNDLAVAGRNDHTWLDHNAHRTEAEVVHVDRPVDQPADQPHAEAEVAHQVVHTSRQVVEDNLHEEVVANNDPKVADAQKQEDSHRLEEGAWQEAPLVVDDYRSR